jgi:UDP-2-acetamido-3-amino-2,3-dideoxy-glucuronate N-acetyltransferase
MCEITIDFQTLNMVKIHPLADVQTAQIGKGTVIWQFCVVLKNARIGRNCNVNAQVFIESDVVIGNNVTIKPGVQVWDGITLEDDVFVSPNATFTNDFIPRSKQYPEAYPKTLVKQGASLGANCTILPGLTIGRYALVGAGAVVTKNVPDFGLVVGNPARHIGYVTKDKIRLNLDCKDENGTIYKLNNGDLTPEQ